MTSSGSVLAVLDSVTQVSVTNRFFARRLDDAGRFRVAKTDQGSLALIVAITAPANLVDIRLPHFRARMNARAEILEDGGGGAAEIVCILEMSGPAVEDPQLFAGLVAAVVDALAEGDPPGKLGQIVEGLIELFMPFVEARGSVLGIWGELVVALHQRRADLMASSWHAAPTDRHDFALEGRRLEVKSTEHDHRQHEFSAEQLVEPQGVSVEVASLVTTRTDTGTSLAELVDEYLDRLESEPDLRLKVQRIVAQTLGMDWRVNFGNHRWDREYAIAAARLISVGDLPSLDVSDARVIRVKMLVDCRDLGEPLGESWPEFAGRRESP